MDTITQLLNKFATLLEEAGYEEALSLVANELWPLARDKHLSIYEVACEYADEEEEQDTSHYQLHKAMLCLSRNDLESPDFHQPF